MIINIQKQENCKLVMFPDNQPHVILPQIDEGAAVVVAPIRSSLELMQLLLVSNALKNQKVIKERLVIPYLMAARSDRSMQSGDSIDLKVVADMINYCGFEEVEILDVHSEAAIHLIENAANVEPYWLWNQYTKLNAVLICPDGGATKKLESYQKHIHIKDVVYCIKKRDLKTGKISLTVLEPMKCVGKNCVIVDDICDGGATFIAIAKQIREWHDKLESTGGITSPTHLTLIVTHGIFSKGFSELEKYFDEIICTNSYQNPTGPEKLLRVVETNL